MKNISTNVKAVNIKDGIRTPIDDEIVVEHSLTIFINEVSIVTLLCSNSNLRELATGYLLSNGFITGNKDIGDVKLVCKGDESTQVYFNITFLNECERTQMVYTTSGGRLLVNPEILEFKSNPLENEFCLSYSDIMCEIDKFEKASVLFANTGGMHSCKLLNKDGKSVFMEDIGRHNAFDKVLGFCVENNLNLSRSYIITSGRVPSDMVVKAIAGKIPILISRSAPTYSSIELAKKAGITLVGFARGNRINIYTHSERIK